MSQIEESNRRLNDLTLFLSSGFKNQMLCYNGVKITINMTSGFRNEVS